MANLEHVKTLKQGSKVWNQWREDNPDIQPDLSEAYLSYESYQGLNFLEEKFTTPYPLDVNYSNANLSHANLTKANLRWANLSKAKLFEANLSGAELNGANLSGAELNGANLQKASLIQANLFDANLLRTNLSKSYIAQANLRRTNLNSTLLNGANLEDSDIRETIFANIDLSKTKGLDKLKPTGPSIIDHRTLVLSKNLPEKFLRDCGLPDQFIEYLPSLIGSLEPIQFYSCFISHSSKDKEFADRLHADLQAQGIRCWYSAHDLKIGDEMDSIIDRAIRIHDKLLLVFSENSITSPWVKKETKEALDKEKETDKKDVLFPIRLDDSIMVTTEQWADDVRRERHIGDFRNWKDHDSYQKSFERLLRDLKNEGS